MKNSKKVIFILLLLILVSVFFIWHKDSNSQILDEVSLRTNEVDKKQLAMFIRNSENEEYQEYSDGNTFPEGYKLNITKSGCSDNDGNKINDEDIISVSSDNKVTIKSKQTVYCYLYFDKKSSIARDVLKDKVNQGGLKQTNTGDLQYRYVGTQDEDKENKINNYVCFGADDCKASITNVHLYRIIGITIDGRIKIQKNSSIGTAQWYSTQYANMLWGSSTIYISTLYNFYSNTSNVSQLMKNIIEYHTWNTGDVTDYSNTINGSYGTMILNQEITSNSRGYYGLAYLSDYYFAYNEEGTQNCYSNSPYCNSWMIPNATDRSSLWSSQTYEWTMTRYGVHSTYNTCNAWFVSLSGNVNRETLDDTFAVRPVFYLTSEAKITGGEGSLDSPYIIE